MSHDPNTCACGERLITIAEAVAGSCGYCSRNGMGSEVMKAKVTKRGKAKWPRRLCDICGYDLAGDGSCSSLCDELREARAEIERLKHKFERDRPRG